MPGQIPFTAERQRIAVIGAGGAGLTASYLLGMRHEVTLFEKADRPGGHAHSVRVADGPDEGLQLDIAFLIFNERNYPTFCRLLAALGELAIAECDHSLNCYFDNENIQIVQRTVGGRVQLPEDRALFPLFRDIWEFGQQAKSDLQNETLDNISMGEYLRAFPETTTKYYLLPLAAGSWSTLSDCVLEMPARTFLRYLDNHGSLDFRDMVRWKSFHSGSQSYVQALLRKFPGKLRLSAEIEVVIRHTESPTVVLAGGERLEFDAVVFATHADQTLKLLADPSDDERRFLGPWAYQKNHVTLHTDPSVMKSDRRTWCAWNFRQASLDAQPYFTYYLNAVQRLEQATREYFVTLNCPHVIPDSEILYQGVYSHPLLTFESIATQSELPLLNGVRNTYFCGSYFGYGFHEDAVKSAVAVARAFGIDLE